MSVLGLFAMVLSGARGGGVDAERSAAAMRYACS